MQFVKLGLIATAAYAVGGMAGDAAAKSDALAKHSQAVTWGARIALFALGATMIGGK